ncbi:hypothetical protein F383_13790 [Gossypium arboreum]|uniref:Uncharacterized protein n=1 Tax=Gossypium arboreum TaxID=29729 RepID=A0A0B0MWX6_GOSAR|nr:hypothetical protein F383_29731 [Gossypium arboreum]KHG29934.1 hypothetical protein F383_13790 [Gossypium arboreum]
MFDEARLCMHDTTVCDTSAGLIWAMWATQAYGPTRADHMVV